MGTHPIFESDFDCLTEMNEDGSSSQGVAEKLKTQISRRFQTFLDKTVPFLVPRWAFTFTLYLIYWARVWMLQGFHIITYALHIYCFNLLIAFLTPKVDPMSFDDLHDEDEDNKQTLPTHQSEFKPFIRRLPEFKVV